MLYAPKSAKARGPPIMGIESRLEGRLKSFPLLFRLSRARLTSIGMSVKLQSRLYPHWTLAIQNGNRQYTAHKSRQRKTRVDCSRTYLLFECRRQRDLRAVRRNPSLQVGKPLSVAQWDLDRPTGSGKRWRLLP